MGTQISGRELDENVNMYHLFKLDLFYGKIGEKECTKTKRGISQQSSIDDLKENVTVSLKKL